MGTWFHLTCYFSFLTWVLNSVNLVNVDVSVLKYLFIFLETNTYRTPLYGQPSWWGEDDANNKEDRRQEDHYSGNGGDLGWERV